MRCPRRLPSCSEAAGQISMSFKNIFFNPDLKAFLRVWDSSDVGLIEVGKVRGMTQCSPQVGCELRINPEKSCPESPKALPNR